MQEGGGTAWRGNLSGADHEFAEPGQLVSGAALEGVCGNRWALLPRSSHLLIRRRTHQFPGTAASGFRVSGIAAPAVWLLELATLSAIRSRRFLPPGVNERWASSAATTQTGSLPIAGAIGGWRFRRWGTGLRDGLRAICGVPLRGRFGRSGLDPRRYKECDLFGGLRQATFWSRRSFDSTRMLVAVQARGCQLCGFCLWKTRSCWLRRSGRG